MAGTWDGTTHADGAAGLVLVFAFVLLTTAMEPRLDIYIPLRRMKHLVLGASNVGEG